MKSLRLGIAAFFIIGFPSVAMAEGGDRGGFRISLTIPEVCSVESASALVDDGQGFASASVFEMCNSGRGFRILASYRVLEAGEQVQINYAGQISQLDASGLSEVAYRQGPTVGNVPVFIATSGLAQGIAISLGMTAI